MFNREIQVWTATQLCQRFTANNGFFCEFDKGNLLTMMTTMMIIGEKKKLLADIFRRPSTRLTVLDNQRGVLFINQSQSSLTAAAANKTSPTPTLEVRTKNAVYCAIVFREFLKELAAISQEHLLIHTDSTDSIRIWLCLGLTRGFVPCVSCDTPTLPLL